VEIGGDLDKSNRKNRKSGGALEADPAHRGRWLRHRRRFQGRVAFTRSLPPAKLRSRRISWDSNLANSGLQRRSPPSIARGNGREHSPPCAPVRPTPGRRASANASATGQLRGTAGLNRSPGPAPESSMPISVPPGLPARAPTSFLKGTAGRGRRPSSTQVCVCPSMRFRQPQTGAFSDFSPWWADGQNRSSAPRRGAQSGAT